MQLAHSTLALIELSVAAVFVISEEGIIDLWTLFFVAAIAPTALYYLNNQILDNSLYILITKSIAYVMFTLLAYSCYCAYTNTTKYGALVWLNIIVFLNLPSSSVAFTLLLTIQKHESEVDQRAHQVVYVDQ